MNKERVTVTLDHDVIRHLDSLIDGLKIRNRSHAVEFLLSKSLGSNKPKKAVIMAGGKGVRLRPITYEIPKPMVPIRGRPLLEHTIEMLRKQDIREVILSIGYLGNKIKEYFGNGSKFGVKINYVEETKPMGTAGALKLVKPLVDESFIVLLGDNLMDINLGELYSFHKESKAKATMALKSVNDPAPFGVTVLKGNKIVQFTEKPKTPPSNLVNAGAYVLEPEVLDMIPQGHSMMEKDVFPQLASKGELNGYFFEGQWYPTDNIKFYENAVKEWRGSLKS